MVTKSSQQPSIYSDAKACVDAGISIIPIRLDGKKRPNYWLLPPNGELFSDGTQRRGWTELTQRLPYGEELTKWFPGWPPFGAMAVIGGPVSGNLEILDVDFPPLIEPFLNKIKQGSRELYEKLVLVRTPRPGLHVYYRSPASSVNKKISLVAHETDKDGEVHFHHIETKGERGYAIVPPSVGACHPTGRPYEYLSARKLPEVETITLDERELLHRISRRFSIPEPESQRSEIRDRVRTVPRKKAVDRSRPGDDFIARTSWSELLEKKGWSFSHQSPEGVSHWTRPGKSEGTSATVNYNDSDKLYVFSSSVEGLDQDQSYDRFAFYVATEHAGDFSAAASKLAQEGFGKKGSPNYGRQWQSSAKRSTRWNRSRRRKYGR